MSRILKRPMFRTGGTPNQGIMHGLVNRRGYNTGSKAEQYADEYYSMLSKYKPPAARFPMGQIGLNLVSGKFAGDGLLANIAGSAKDPYEQFVQADDATRNIDYQTRMTSAKMGISRAEAEAIARAKAAGQNGYLKKETVEGAFDHFLEENAKSANELKGYEKPNLSQKYQVGDAEFKSYVWRNLKTTSNPQGQEVERNYVGFVPFDVKNQEFSYDTMMPGMYYYDPNIRGFVQRIPEDGKDTYFKYDKMTFEKYVMDTSTKPPSWKKLGTN